jgi:L-alanine-DL-glutamate epimerase-like enolase superfamily enzyme
VKITAVRAAWLRAEIPAERRHTTDFGVNDSFNTCLVEIDTDTGLTGVGEAKVGVGARSRFPRRRRRSAPASAAQRLDEVLDLEQGARDVVLGDAALDGTVQQSA